MFKSINAIEFNRRFYSNDSCYQYLMERKWEKDSSVLSVAVRKVLKGEHTIIGDVKIAGMMKVLQRTLFFMV